MFREQLTKILQHAKWNAVAKGSRNATQRLSRILVENKASYSRCLSTSKVERTFRLLPVRTSMARSQRSR